MTTSPHLFRWVQSGRRIALWLVVLTVIAEVCFPLHLAFGHADHGAGFAVVDLHNSHNHSAAHHGHGDRHGKEAYANRHLNPNWSARSLEATTPPSTDEHSHERMLRTTASARASSHAAACVSRANQPTSGAQLTLCRGHLVTDVFFRPAQPPDGHAAPPRAPPF